MKFIFKDEPFSFELLRAVGYAPYGGADIGECLKTAYEIKEGDFESWYEEWNKTAQRVHALADEALAHNQRVSAREAYWRASNYYRTAEFFLHGNREDPRILETWGKSRDTFREAMQLLDTPVEAVQIPYENTVLPGYFYRPDDSVKPRPTLIVNCGFDSTKEESYFEVAAAAIQRQYNCLTFEGPGQGSLIREQQIPLRYDWEKVITPVIDYLLTRPDVEPSQVALMGVSIGGYMAPRAAAFDHRLAAVIANDGLYTYRFSDKTRALMPVAKWFGRGAAEYGLRQSMKRNTGVRWAIGQGLYAFNVDSIWDLIEATEPCSLEGIAERVTCPTLVCEAENDHFFAGQPKQLYEALTCPKTFMRFTAEEGADTHCHFGALLLCNYRMFEWLDETLGIDREEAPDQRSPNLTKKLSNI